MDTLEQINYYAGANIIEGLTGEIPTPVKECSDMVDLADDKGVYDRVGAKYLDLYCKSGRFLKTIYNKLMSNESLRLAYNNDLEALNKDILSNYLYGIAPSQLLAAIIRKELYGDPNYTGNIIVIENYRDKVKHKNFGTHANGTTKTFGDILREGFGDSMRFDVVIGNPPYNNDLYIPFIKQGFNLLKDENSCEIMITPAKWQAKGGKANEEFRKNIVPHMSKIVYYPDCLDVFAIAEPSGVCYYLIDKYNDKSEKCEVTNLSVLSPIINSTVTRSIARQQTLWNYGSSIVDKIIHLECYKPYRLTEAKELKAYTININKQLLNCLSRVWDWDLSCIKPEYIGKGGCLFDKDGKAKVFGLPKLVTRTQDNSSGTSINIFTTDNIEEAKSFVSWAYTKFIGFLIIINKYAQNVMNDIGWRFVPDPGPFNRIFEDKPLPGYTPDENGEYVDSNGKVHCSLYVKYNLTPEEINIIESVIKEQNNMQKQNLVEHY